MQRNIQLKLFDADGFISTAEVNYNVHAWDFPVLTKTPREPWHVEMLDGIQVIDFDVPIYPRPHLATGVTLRILRVTVDDEEIRP